MDNFTEKVSNLSGILSDMVAAMGFKGGPGSGNWGHTSFQRIEVGRGGSDPKGTLGGGLVSLGLGPGSSVEERRHASAQYREERGASGRYGDPKKWLERAMSAHGVVEKGDAGKVYKWGWKHYHEWLEGLSEDEIKSIKLYTGSGYRNVNRLLRKDEWARPKPKSRRHWTREFLQERADRITDAVNKGSIPADMTVQRGIKAGPMSQIRSLPVGSTFVDRGIISTSVRELDWKGAGNNVTVFLPKGTKGAYIGFQGGQVSGSWHETELLLPPGTRFMLLDKTVDGVTVAVVSQGVKSFGSKGGPGSGNWGHTSFQRIEVGRGGSDPKGTFGGGLGALGLDPDSSVEERRAASAEIRKHDRSPEDLLEIAEERFHAARKLEVHNLELSHEWGMAAYGQWALDLTPGEQHAINNYTGAGYRNLNGALRRSKKWVESWGSAPGESLAQRMETSIKGMDRALDKASVPHDVQVARRIKSAAIKEIRALKPGDTFRDNGYVSTTLHAGATTFGDMEAARILLPKGAKGAYVGTPSFGLSTHPGETELLLARGSRFMVISNDPGNITLALVGQGTPENVSSVIADVRALGQKQVERFVPTNIGIRSENLNPLVDEDDITRAIDKFNDWFPELDGLLTAEAG